jgi:Cu/Ag efflux pump CusA
VLGQPGSPAVSAARLASYLIAALIGILLLVQAATGSWRLALLVLAALPVPVAAGILAAVVLGTPDSLAALAGLLGVLAIAIHQAFRITAAIRRGIPAHRGSLTQDALVNVAADASGPVVVAAAVAAVALLPFIVMGDVAGLELLSTAAAVILAGLVAATLLNTLVLPAACLWLGQLRGSEARSDQGLAEAHVVPFPRAEPDIPGAPRPGAEATEATEAGEPDHPVP